MSHYFETPSGDDPRFDVPMRLWGNEVVLTSSRGVFSGGALDLGTSVLLRSVDPPANGRLLDLGCGIGTIAIALALGSPDVTVTAVDVNDRALELTRANADRLGVSDRVVAARPEAFDEAATYDEIWSNPPIRIGKPALHQLLTTWLARLEPNGTAYLVVARNLGADSLASWLAEQGYGCRRVASAKGFRVLAVTVTQTD